MIWLLFGDQTPVWYPYFTYQVGVILFSICVSFFWQKISFLTLWLKLEVICNSMVKFWLKCYRATAFHIEKKLTFYGSLKHVGLLNVSCYKIFFEHRLVNALLFNVSYFENIICYRLVSGSGDIKLTKDGNVLLHEMVCILQRASWVTFVGAWNLKYGNMLKSYKHYVMGIYCQRWTNLWYYID